VGDTAFRAIPGAEVTVLEKHLHAETDSLGRFFIPVPPGRYMVSIAREGFATKVAGVTVPSDSGRSMTALLLPRREMLHREAQNVTDLEFRQSWRDRVQQPFYTREDIQKLDIVWIVDLVSMAARTKVDVDCSVVIDGGPMTAELSTLTVEDVEGVEVLTGAELGRPIRMPPPRPTNRKAATRTKAPRPDAVGPTLNSNRAGSENQGKVCATVYVWLR
jgi:hypothetical protein